MITFPRRRFLKTTAAISAAAAAAVMPRAVFGAAEKPKIKLGQIGTTHAHADKLGIYRKSGEFDVVGVVEPDDKRWAAAQNKPAYKDLPRLTEEQLLNSPGLQAVMIETAVADLVPAGTRCLSAGKHIHLDKPAGADFDAFAKLLKISEEMKLLVQLGYMLRYSPATLLLQRLMKEKALGDVFEVNAVMSKVVSPGERKSLAAFSGGMMFELGCHVIDSLVALLGKPRKITAWPMASTNAGDGLKDNCLAVFEYEKATATVRATGLEVDGNHRRQFVVCGTGGTLHVEPIEPPTVKLSLAKEHGDFKKGTQEVPMPKYARFIGDAADFAAIIRGEKQSDYPPAHDLAVHECVLRAGGMM